MADVIADSAVEDYFDRCFSRVPTGVEGGLLIGAVASEAVSDLSKSPPLPGSVPRAPVFGETSSR